MPDTPRERRRTKPARPVDPDADTEAAEPESEAAEAEPKARAPSGKMMVKARNSAVWPLATGLALGFAVGREAYRFGLDPPHASTDTAASAAPIAPDKAVKTYTKEADFPADWIKDTDLGAAGSVLSGLTDAQKTTVMQALNSRDCSCGCGMGSLAICLKKDPNCPRSPAMAKVAVELVKQGKGISDILAGIDAKQKEMGSAKPAPAAAGPEVPATPKKVAINSFDPRKGPKAAKVTIVEFSDFQ